MKPRYPLFLKVLFWLFLNILIIGIGLLIILNVQYQTGIESLFGGKTSRRIQELSQIIGKDLNSRSQSEWDNILKNYSQIYEVQFFVFRCNGTQIAGDKIVLPADIVSKLASLRVPGLMQGRGPPPGKGYWRSMLQPDRTETKYFFIHSTEPKGYWAGVRINIDRDSTVGGGDVLVAKFDSLFKSSLFDLKPLLFAVGAAILFSALFWLPLIKSFTGSIREITIATEKISNGNFSQRINEKRKDELGILAVSINQLAAQLERFVKGQRRFLGDTAHELCSPIARIEMALGILEQRADNKNEQYVKDIREDLNVMSGLIKELLYFSKTSLQETKIELQKVELKKIVERILTREGVDNSLIKINIPDGFTVIANPELIDRAIANLIRNSIRYAGKDGAIEVSAVYESNQSIITVADNGPGLPEGELEKIFEPFYRVEASHSREYGGAGLGLAITKASVEACRGTVRAINRKPHGLLVEIHLPTQR